MCLEKIVFVMSEKSKDDVRASWENLVYSSIISIFAHEGNLDESFMDVGPYLDCGFLIPMKMKESTVSMVIVSSFSTSAFSWS